MGYQAAVEAAGYEVLAYELFGSYQGQWMMKVRDPESGEIGYIHDWFGSCTVCDSFQAEFCDFGWDDEDSDEYQQRLREFGERYTALPVQHWMDWAHDVERRLDDEDEYVDMDEEERYQWFLKQEGIV